MQTTWPACAHVAAAAADDAVAAAAAHAPWRQVPRL